jgi:hypothetical protein
MSPKEKRELIRVLENIEETLLKNWTGYGDFQLLQERMFQLRMILEESSDQKGKGRGK